MAFRSCRAFPLSRRGGEPHQPLHQRCKRRSGDDSRTAGHQRTAAYRDRLASPVAPGTIISIAGTAFAPAVPVSATSDQDGMVGASLAGVRVFVGGLPAPLLATQHDQLVAIVPYGIGSRTSTCAQVEYRGLRANAYALPVRASAPGVFSSLSPAVGLPPLNEDLSRDSALSPRRPAAIVFHATGEGETSPPGEDGKINRAPLGEPDIVLPAPVLPVEVTIDGIPAQVLWAAAAPGLVSGIMQVQARIPVTVRGVMVPLLLKVGTATSQQGMQIAVR